MAKHAIMGKSQLTAEQMKKFLLLKNGAPQLNGMDVLEFCKLYIEEGEAEGVRGDYAFAQSLHETGFFKFSGQVLPAQNNYAGLGATNNSGIGKGAWFSDQRKGVRAQIQHLKAYASYGRLNNECVDPRFTLVTRGCAPNLEDLAGKWAVPGYPSKYSSYEAAYAANETYGQKILTMYNQIAGVVVNKPVKEDVKKPVKNETNNNVTDENICDKIGKVKKDFINSTLGLFGKIFGIGKK